MRRLMLTLFFITVLLGMISQVISAASEIDILENEVDYTFGGQITFRAKIQSDAPMDEVLVFIRNEGDTNTIVGKASINNGEVVYTHDLTQQSLRAFSQVEYWFRVTSQDGETITSLPESFYYEDNRFDWQILENKPFRVHWYDGDLNFAQSVLDVAQAGYRRILSFIPLSEPPLVDIYVYASGLEMQSTLQLAGQTWIAGHADPDLSVMVVTLPPGPDQLLETERQIPHELLHILIYQEIGADYRKLPSWYNEGLASMAELKPNPDYYIVLNSAVENESFIPITSLCDSFPTDASNVYLAYAQSESFTRFIYQEYGTSGLQALMEANAEGMGCDRATEIALNSSLAQLETRWRRETFNENVIVNAVGNLLPWFVLLGVVMLIPLILSMGGWLWTKKTDSEKIKDGVKKQSTTPGD
jgi:hypothetical protein